MPYIAHADSGNDDFMLIPPDSFSLKSLELSREEHRDVLPSMLMNYRTMLYEPIDPSIIPTHLMVGVQLPVLPDFMDARLAGYVSVVSDRLRAMMEDLEPDVHQFIPMTILRSPGDAYEGPFFYLVRQTLAQGMIPERSPAAMIEDRGEGRRLIKMHPKASNPYDFVFNSSVVGNLHYWEDASDQRKKTGTTYFITGKLVSDTFRERFRAVGMTGLTFGRRQPLNTDIDAGGAA